MGILKSFDDRAGNKINIVLRDVRTFEFTAKNNQAAIALDTFTSVKFGIKTNITDTAFLASGTGVIIDDGVDPALLGRFDVTINFGAAGIVAAFSEEDTLIIAFLEIALVDASGNDQTPAQYPIIINRDINV